MSPSAKNKVLWVLQILTGILFVGAGALKIYGTEMSIEVFGAIGFGQGLRAFTGVIEAFGGVMLLTPSFAGLGALLLAPAMVGAAFAHHYVIGGSPLPPLVILVVLLVIAWGRRERTIALVTRRPRV